MSPDGGDGFAVPMFRWPHFRCPRMAGSGCPPRLDALDEPSRYPKQKLVIQYRNCVVHRIRPSIDHSELSPLLQDRVGQPVYDTQGKQTGVSYAILAASKADFQFDELYEAITSYLDFVVRMLCRLKALPRFA
jgi:hypothetical protein